MAAFLVKILIGTLIHLYFIDPNYFNDLFPDVKIKHFETGVVFEQILYFADLKLRNGILDFKYQEYGATHQELLSIISIPFVYFGRYVLNICPLNTLFSLLASANLLYYAKRYLLISGRQLKFIFFLSAFFPFTLIPSILFRDIAGMMFISIGFVLLFTAQGYLKWLVLPFVCGLFYLQREVYPFLLLLSITYFFIKNRWGIAHIIFPLFLLIVLVMTYFVTSAFSFYPYKDNVASNSNLFFRIGIGVLGPFPWSQFFTWDQAPERAYYLQDFIMCCLNLSFIFIFVRNIKQIINDKFSLNIMVITAILISIFGAVHAKSQISYVAIGVFFLIPFMSYYITLSRMRTYFFISLMIMLLLNLIKISFSVKDIM